MISNQFIDQLFENQHFRNSLEQFKKQSSKNEITNDFSKDKIQLDSIIEEISSILQANFVKIIQKECSSLYNSNKLILQEFDELKQQLCLKKRMKTENSTIDRDTKSSTVTNKYQLQTVEFTNRHNQFQTQIFFDSQLQSDIKRIRNCFQQGQDEIRNKVLVNSFELQESNFDVSVDDKINASIQGSLHRIQITLQQKFQKYSTHMQLRIQQLKKTIASIIEAMNDKNTWTDTYKHNQTNISFTKGQKHVHNVEQSAGNADNSHNADNADNKIGYSSQKNPQIEVSIRNSSSKVVQTLNKSIEVSRSRIKSLFGFKKSSQ